MAKQMLTIVVLLLCNTCFSQRVDTVFNKEFDRFRALTDSLITELGISGVKTESDWKPSLISSKMVYYCDTIRKQLAVVSARGISFNLSTYFNKGTRPRSQDFSSPIAQLECSYSHFIEEFRKAGNVDNEIRATLTLKNWLTNGFPETKYCPYVYAPVEVDFSKPKPVFVDTVPKKSNNH